MTASAATLEFLDQLRIRGVELWVEGDRLRYNAPRGIINDDVLSELRKRKGELIVALRSEQPAAVDSAITPVSRDGLLGGAIPMASAAGDSGPSPAAKNTADERDEGEL